MRKKEFDPAAVIEDATRIFRKQGFLATSMDDLVKQTGVSRYGLYEVFGDKKGLFLASLDCYSDGFLKGLLAPLERPQSSLKELKQYFVDFSALSNSEEGELSCLMCLTANQITGMDPDIDARLQKNGERLLTAFKGALQRAQKKGEISKAIDVTDMSFYLIGLSHGVASLLRSKRRKEIVDAYVRIGLESLKN